MGPGSGKSTELEAQYHLRDDSFLLRLDRPVREPVTAIRRDFVIHRDNCHARYSGRQASNRLVRGFLVVRNRIGGSISSTCAVCHTTSFILGSLLELYAYELFRRGQQHAVPTCLCWKRRITTCVRLAREKFGLALWLSTQRPSEIPPTVLSQCNNWVALRLTSEKDLNAVQSASEWADRREVRRIAGLARQTAMIFGGSISMPTMLRALNASPRPRSDDGAFRAWANPAPRVGIPEDGGDLV
jgi:hypothetical protein